jgi:hypothetical protein
MLVSLQGKIWAGVRSAEGAYTQPRWVGNAPACTLELATESAEKFDSYTGSRLQLDKLPLSKTATLSLTLDEWTLDNLSLALYGSESNLEAGALSGEALPSPLAAGDFLRLEHGFISDLALTTASAPLVAGSDYRIESAPAGLIEILKAQTEAVSAAYSYAAVENLTIFTTAAPERWLFLDGINTRTGESVLLDLFRCQFDPVSSLGLIHEEYGSLELTAAVLYDPINAQRANLGGFANLRRKGA